MVPINTNTKHCRALLNGEKEGDNNKKETMIMMTIIFTMTFFIDQLKVQQQQHSIEDIASSLQKYQNAQ